VHFNPFLISAGTDGTKTRIHFRAIKDKENSNLISPSEENGRAAFTRGAQQQMRITL
jgi:hypothetical protein